VRSALTFKFVKVPGCDGSSVIVFLLMSKISSLGSEVSYGIGYHK